MRANSYVKYFQFLLVATLYFSCTNKMEQMYLLKASSSAYPTGTPIDSDGDGKIDGIDVNNDGIIDMKFVSPVGLPATGIDVNNDGKADFYLYTTNTGSTFKKNADGSGSVVAVIIRGGALVGYDLDSNGTVDIYVSPTNASSYNVGGTASSVTSDIILSLTINSSSFEYLTISTSGTFTFSSSLNAGNFYQVAIASTTQQCTLANASGVITSSDITNVAITCGSLSIGGTITGPATIGTIMMSLTIDNSSTEFLTVSGTSPLAFSFLSKLNAGSFYKVSIVSSADSCQIASFSGTIATTDVTNISVTCFATGLTVGGTTATLGGSISLSLTANGSTEYFTTSSTTGYTFPYTRLTQGNSYVATIVTQPTGQVCTLANAIGTIGSSNIINVNVTCAGTYAITVSIPNKTFTTASILALTINNSSTEYLPVGTGVSSIPFTSTLNNNSAYNVQFFTAPLKQDCKLSNNIGVINAPKTVTVKCGVFTDTVNTAEIASTLGTVFDTNSDGMIDGIDVDGDGIYNSSRDIQITGDTGDGNALALDIDGVAGVDFYLCRNASGIYELNSLATCLGTIYTVVGFSGHPYYGIYGYDTNGDGIADIDLNKNPLYTITVTSFTWNTNTWLIFKLSVNGANASVSDFFTVTNASSSFVLPVSFGTGTIENLTVYSASGTGCVTSTAVNVTVSAPVTNTVTTCN